MPLVLMAYCAIIVAIAIVWWGILFCSHPASLFFISTCFQLQKLSVWLGNGMYYGAEFEVLIEVLVFTD